MKGHAVPHNFAELLWDSTDLGLEIRLISQAASGTGDLASAPPAERLQALLNHSATSREINRRLESMVAKLVEALPPQSHLRILQLSPLAAPLYSGLPSDQLSWTIVSPDSSAVALGPSVQSYGWDEETLLPEDVLHAAPYDVVLLHHPSFLSPVPELLPLVQRCLRVDGRLLLAQYLPTEWMQHLAGDLAPLSPETWSDLLPACGFRAPALTSDTFSSLLAASLEQGPEPTEADETEATTSETSHWLIVAGEAEAEQDLAHDLALRLIHAEHSVAIARDRPVFAQDELEVHFPFQEAAGWTSALETLQEQASPRILYLGQLDPTTATCPTTSKCLPFLALAQSLRDSPLATAPQLTVLTRQALPLCNPEGELLTPPAPAQAALAGLCRVFLNEHPEFEGRLVDLHPEKEGLKALAGPLFESLLHPGAEHELALSPSHQWGLRTRSVPSRQTGSATTTFSRLMPTAPRLTALEWQPLDRPTLQPDQIRVDVKAAGLNFRDLMGVLNQLPPDVRDEDELGPLLGLEGAGVVTEVGEEVTRFSTGDRVMFFGKGCLSTEVVTAESTASLLQPELSYAAAATIPSVFATVLYTLKYCARLQAGERILIHSATGGVGLAALQYARLVGAEPFVTVGTEEKRHLVRELGVPENRIFNSRTLAFADGIMAATQGEGVDVVLNSLSGAAMEKSFEVLRPFGRFLELGKVDFFNNTAVGLRPFQHNLTYHGVDLLSLIDQQPNLVQEIFAEVQSCFEKGELHPLPHRIFASEEAGEALREMREGKHIGKLIVTPPVTQNTAPLRWDEPVVRYQADRSYLITGGTRGFGLATAKQLAKLGARHLILVGVSKQRRPELEEFLTWCEGEGVHVRVETCDVSEPEEISALAQRLQASDVPPVAGIVHAAAKYADAALNQMSTKDFQEVVAIKAQAGQALLEVFGDGLDFLLLYSSVSYLFGNPGQGNYAAGNAVLEALAAQAQARGIQGKAIAWGPIADVGILAENEALREMLKKEIGITPLSAAESLQVLDPDHPQSVWTARSPTVVVADLHHGKAGKSRLGPLLRWSRFQEVFPPRLRNQEGSQDLRELLEQGTPEEVRAFLLETMQAELTAMLHLKENSLDENQPLVEYGIDSLTGVELGILIEEKFGVRLAASSFDKNATLLGLVDTIQAALQPSEKLSGDAQIMEEIAQSHGEQIADLLHHAGKSDMQGDKSTPNG